MRKIGAAAFEATHYQITFSVEKKITTKTKNKIMKNGKMEKTLWPLWPVL